MKELNFKRIKLTEKHMWCDIIPDAKDETVSNFCIYHDEYVSSMFCFGLKEQDVEMFIRDEDVLTQVLSDYITLYYEGYTDE